MNAPRLARTLALLVAVGCAPARRPAPPSPAPVTSAQRGRAPAPTMTFLAADWLTRADREREERPDAMLDALGIQPGMTVADVGAGVGFHTVRLARRVGAQGRVIATDIQPEMLTLLRANLAHDGVTHVTVALASDRDLGLPAHAVDLVLMVDVFHELRAPEAFLAALRTTLRPGGRVALVEFRGEDPTVPIRDEHRMTAAQVIRELTAAGYTLVQREEFLPWQHILVFRDGRP